MGAGAAIEDDQRAVVAPHLNTRRVAAVAQRDSTRLGQGSAGTPKPDIHPCTLARVKGCSTRTVGTTPVPALPQQLVSGNEPTTHTATVNRSVAGSQRQTTAFAESARQWTSVSAAVTAKPPNVRTGDLGHSLAWLHPRPPAIFKVDLRGTRTMWVRVVIAISLLLWPIGAFAQTEKRIALLIGNKDYKAGVGALTNPLNDIRIVGEALRTVGFEVLKPVENAQRSAMLIAVHAFAAKLKAAGPEAVGFLYYSGHGIASAGENYLVPTDVDEPSTVLLSVQGVKQSEVLAILRGEAPNAAHYLVLDACRNTLQGARGGKGFVPVGQQSGVLVAFAAEPGKTASDLGRESGPYASALATELVKPGQNDLLMFHNVRVAVIQKTGGDQVPWTEDGIQRPQRVMFGGETKAVPAPASQVPTATARLSEAAEAWDRAKDTKSIATLEAFIARYKDTFYGDLAWGRINELKQSSAASPPKQATPPPPSATPRSVPDDGKKACRQYAKCIDSLGSSLSTRGPHFSEIYGQGTCGPKPSQC